VKIRNGKLWMKCTVQHAATSTWVQLCSSDRRNTDFHCTCQSNATNVFFLSIPHGIWMPCGMMQELQLEWSTVTVMLLSWELYASEFRTESSAICDHYGALSREFWVALPWELLHAADLADSWMWGRRVWKGKDWG